MSFSPQEFLSNINRLKGLAKPNLFEVLIAMPDYISGFAGGGATAGNNDSPITVMKSLTLQCEATELPGKTLNTIDVDIYGPTFKVPIKTQYNDITLTFICTNDFYERKLFERWLQAIIPSKTNNLRFAKEDDTQYMTTIEIVQFDSIANEIFTVKLIDAFPTGVAAQALSWNDDNFHRLGVQFAYQKYETPLPVTYNFFSNKPFSKNPK